MSRSIDYGNMMHDAMRRLIQHVLEDVAKDGLPGQHHFFITFDTHHPKVAIADWLAERYPEEMTIVIQHWFENLEVTDEGFSITLNFGDSPEPLYIPFDAIRTFVDPSVEFGLRFETHENDEDDDAGEGKDTGDFPDSPEDEAPMTDIAEPETDQDKADAEIVSLDSFRK